MTHIVIDTDVIEKLLAASDAVEHAADNRLCTCEYNVPYDSGQVERVLVTKCFRCKAIDQYNAARVAVAKAIQDEASPAALVIHGGTPGVRLSLTDVQFDVVSPT